ncbi:alpha/beta fold hydrolase [Streptomyces sp. NBC_01314]|uniref:alpha/beta fold hydrolase n=1 Tax=Streptomyces sp. NBC_01314 TaxID=2903821 RepID=UPI00308B638D|nr:alpha/beta hydrolase [Streptomyces sp. NBC_01314]
MARAAPPKALAWAQRAIARRPDSMDVLRATDIPAVVVTGAEDLLVGAEEATRTAAALRQGRLVVLPEVGHLQPLEAPERINTILSALLDDVATADRNRENAC